MFSCITKAELRTARLKFVSFGNISSGVSMSLLVPSWFQIQELSVGGSQGAEALCLFQQSHVGGICVHLGV